MPPEDNPPTSAKRALHAEAEISFIEPPAPTAMLSLSSI